MPGALALKDGFSIAVDEATGRIVVMGRGFWTPAATTEHFRLLEDVVARVRAQRGTVRVLVDLRTAPVQSTETSEIIQQATQRIYKPTDRLAIVRTSRLLDLQLKRAVDSNPIQTFATIDEAEAWLQA
ncbi:MAG: hypothetical protein JWR77_700 [Rhizorhabdus sp.]|nr:hypothetical protein [Rhizorhabdus sp.]